MKLLLVEDDKKIATTVKRGLEADGFTVEVAFDGNDGLWLASEGSYDLVVLDIMLPGRNGYRICADLRAAGNWTPILMLTAKDGELDEAEALDTGADDYLTKPFSYPVLVARVRTLVRRATGRNPAPWPSVTCASILANGGSGAAPMSAPSLHESSRCWSSWSAAPGRSCPRRRSWRECGDLAVLVLRGGLPEVPDVAIALLCVPVGRLLDQGAVAGDDVADHHRGHAHDPLGLVGDRHLGVLGRAVANPVEHIGGAGREWEYGLVIRVLKSAGTITG